MNETSVERIIGESYCTVSTAERKFINKLNSLKEKYPDEVDIVADNFDGSVMARVPFDWFVFVRPPIKHNLTDEQRQERAERMRKAKGGNE